MTCLVGHKLSIDNSYLCIIKAICDSSHNLIPIVGRKGNFQPIVGWNDYVLKELTQMPFYLGSHTRSLDLEPYVTS